MTYEKFSYIIRDSGLHDTKHGLRRILKMKRRIGKILLTAMACMTIIACFALTGCGSNDTAKYNGTYHGYLDGAYFTDNGIPLEGTYTLTLKDGQWTGSDDSGNVSFFDLVKKGDYEIKDGKIILHFKMGNIQMSVGEGTIEGNSFTFTIPRGNTDYKYKFIKEEE